jgi:hypothetical protein
VLFPVSVEVANSLLRITELLDRRYEEPKYFLRCRPLLDRYVRWLKAQRVEKTMHDKKYCGWHSENITRPDQIHLWLTSEIIVFLLTYQLRFQEGIAHKMLKASGLQVDQRTRHERDQSVSSGEYWKNGDLAKPDEGWLANEPLMGHPSQNSRFLIYQIIHRADHRAPYFKHPQARALLPSFLCVQDCHRRYRRLRPRWIPHGNTGHASAAVLMSSGVRLRVRLGQ